MSAILDTYALPRKILEAIQSFGEAAKAVGEEAAMLAHVTEETRHQYALERIALMLAIAPLLKKTLPAGDHIDLPNNSLD